MLINPCAAASTGPGEASIPGSSEVPISRSQVEFPASIAPLIEVNIACASWSIFWAILTASGAKETPLIPQINFSRFTPRGPSGLSSKSKKAWCSHFVIASPLLERDLTNYSGLDPFGLSVGFRLWFKRTGIGKIGFQLLEEILDLICASEKPVPVLPT
jgi:hypothetical protein